MDESGRFSVKTMQPIWLLIDKSIVLRYELPTNFRGYDVVVKGGGVRVWCAGHGGRCSRVMSIALKIGMFVMRSKGYRMRERMCK